MAAPEFPVRALVFALLICSVASYPNGKVTMSCGGMTPQHGHSPQSEPVHQITVSQMKFKPGDQIQVTVSGPPFRGFLLEARDAEDLSGPPLGSFTLIDSEVSQLLTCEDVQGFAVSHTSSSKKTEIKVYWNAPSSAPNHIRFLATVVEKYKIYWVKIPSHVISQPNAPPFTTPEATAQPLTTSPSVAHLTKPFSASECGNTKFCVRSPSNCDPENEPSCVFLSFTRDDQSVVVEMSGPSEGYLSFAFSRDRWMGDDDAYLCIREDQTVYIQPSYLTGRSSPVMDSRGTLKDMAWRLADGVIQCSFRRNITLPGVRNRFALNESYYIFLAEGAAHDDQSGLELIESHSFVYRGLEFKACAAVCSLIFLFVNSIFCISSLAILFTSTISSLWRWRSLIITTAHLECHLPVFRWTVLLLHLQVGRNETRALMFVAWMTTVSIGVLVARFFRSVWSKAFFLGEAAWFQVHRMLMLATSVLTCTAFVLPFVYRGGWSRRAGYHPYLGCTVMILAVLQPLLATFRPSLHDPRRQVFNWTHWSVGTAARIIAVAAMFLGMDLPGLNLPSPQKTYAMMGFVVWHIGTEVLLEIHAYRLSRKVEILDDDRIQILQSLTVAEAEGHVFKKAVLVIYICGNLTFLMIFLSAINQV